MSDDYKFIYVVGGRSFAYLINPYFYSIEIIVNNGVMTTNTSVLYTNSLFGATESDIVRINDYVYILFGSYLKTFSSPTITALNYKTGYPSVFSFSDNMSIYGHRAAHYGNSIYVFGGGLSINSLISDNKATNRFYKLQFSDSDIPSLNCSTGTVFNETCLPCPAGTYYSNSVCVDCPTGTFSNNIALKNRLQCIPCAYSHFSPHTGATYCLECSSNSYCPIGSSYQMGNFSIETFQISNLKLIQETLLIYLNLLRIYGMGLFECWG